MKNRRNLALSLAASACSVVTAVPAFAAGIVDYTALGTSITGELTPAIAAALPIGGTILAVAVGWKMVKRFTK